jgi:hypothetical protein
MKTLSIELPDRLHVKARSLAREDGMSLKQFMVASVSHEVIRQETLDFFQAAAKNYSPKDFEEALSAIPDVPPEERDKLP